MAAVRSAFKPEFINRLDDVIVFDPLDPRSWSQIVDIQLSSCRSGWRSVGSLSRCRCPPRSGWPSAGSTRCTARVRCAG